MPRRFTEAQVVSIQNLAPKVKSFSLKVEDEEKRNFKPGQFITLDLPVGTKRLDRWKSYSLANAPEASDTFELCIVRMPDGKGTEYLFEELKEGESLSFKGPEGSFVLPNDLDREIVLICTGTGVAPFKSMIDHVFLKKIPYKNIHLIFGTRTMEDVLYREAFEKYAREDSRFEYSICLSREEASEDWPAHIHSGYVHQVYENNYTQTEDTRLFMLCGWSQMIDDAVVRLQNMGYSNQQISFELYG